MTKEAGEPRHAGNNGGKSVWYCWMATADESVVFNTVAVILILCSPFTPGKHSAAWSPFGRMTTLMRRPGNSEPVTFQALSGQAYHIAVDGSVGAAGNFKLNWNSSTVGPPAPATSSNQSDPPLQVTASILSTERSGFRYM